MGEAFSSSRRPSSSSDRARRPSTPPKQTDPSFESLLAHQPRPRNRSPYARTHLRSHSGSSAVSAPPMIRAHSLPTAMAAAHQTDPGLKSTAAMAAYPPPMYMPGSPKRTRSPFRQDDSYAHSGAPSVCDISEDAELELTPKPAPIHTTSVLPTPLSTLRSGRRRPASPLHHVSGPFGTTSAPAVTTPTSTSTSSSPLLSASKFNEPFPGMDSRYPSSLASSSVPSTPTSMRSRSPSISSLETIPDTPDAEAEAIEADRIARLKAAADREKEGGDTPRRSSLDVPGGSGRTLGFGKRDSRKRWSVCGAERRGDLDLETIWED
ncbi:hypothetical protein BS50DRAFT_605242 [Corynespora cassiicola Philippines]|uniref:Basic proline-rich protein n=1 Tax=Corynespora cassiicola Philippines TaxID=1448308 RepID=A0A2T2N225_CORCC|nr:hypothetical protein BS50DRAFT_605242 [Corynespora cassiicola Philippines]